MGWQKKAVFGEEIVVRQQARVDEEMRCTVISDSLANSLLMNLYEKLG